MSSNSSQPSLYSSIPSNSLITIFSNTSSPLDRNLATEDVSKSSNSSLVISQSLKDGNNCDSESSSDEEGDDDPDIIWDVPGSSSKPVATKAIEKSSENSEYDYMLYIIKKIVERHGVISTLCGDENFRRPVAQMKPLSSSRNGKRGRKRKKR